MAEDLNEALFCEVPVACAVFRARPDQPDPWEAEVANVNPAFEAFFGQTAGQVVGWRLSALAQGLKLLPPDWGRLGLEAQSRPVQAQWEADGRMVHMRAFSSGPGCLLACYSQPPPMAPARQAQLDEAMDALLRITSTHLDYQVLTERVRALSGARFAVMNLYGPDGEESTTQCVAGPADEAAWAQRQLGFALAGRVWSPGLMTARRARDPAPRYLNSLEDLIRSRIPPLTLRQLSDTLGLGQVVVAPIAVDDRLLGDYMLFMPQDQALADDAPLRTFCRCTALVLERIRTEGALCDSESCPENHQAIACMGRWEWDHSDDTLYFSQEVNRIFGIDPLCRQATYAQYMSRVFPQDEAAVRRCMAEHCASGQPYEITCRIRDARDRYQWVRVAGRTLMDGQGRPLRTVGTVQDITPIKQSEEKIQQLLDENETIFNGTQDALFLIEVLGPDRCRYLRNNSAHAVKTGISHEDFAGRTPREVFGEELGTRFCAEYTQCIEAGHAVSFEQTLPLGDAERTWLTTLTPMFRSGRNTYIVGSMEDITPQKEFEQSIRNNLARSQVLINLLQHPVKSVESYLGYALEQAVRITDSGYGHILRVDEQSRQIHVTNWTQSAMTQDAGKIPLAQALEESGVWSRAIRRRKALMINDFQAENLLGSGNSPEHDLILRYLVVPVFDGGKIVSLIGVANKAQEYTDDDVMQLTILMNNVWVVVQRKRGEELLNQEKDLFKTTLLSIGDGIIAVDRQGRVTVMNEVAQSMTGWAQQEALGRPFDEVCPTLDEATRQRRESPIRQVLDTGRKMGPDSHSLLIDKDGGEHPVAESAAPITGAGGRINGVVLAYRDVSTEQERIKAIEYLSYHDPLTGLYNRAFFNEEMRRLDTTRNLPIAIVMSDINGLKLTDDAFGHAMGDKLLQKAAEVIRSCCREDDIIARVGGDEFVLLLPQTSNEDAERVVERIRALCASTRIGSVVLSISFGWEAKTSPQEDMRQVLKKAEDRMYRRKLFDSPSMRGRTVQAIIQTLYEAHPREERHSRRVSRLCEMVSKKLNLSEREVKEITSAGLLHDIGKIAIDDRILNKAGRLTPEEWREIKRHPEIGYRILSSVNDLSETADCILAHHERWDGSGYPSLLRGAQIPLQARIIALADAFDAMTSDRDYSAKLSEEEALEQLRRNAGTQFDPDLVDVFIAAYQERPVDPASSPGA